MKRMLALVSVALPSVLLASSMSAEPTMLDCWDDYFSAISQCQVDFNGQDASTVTARKACMAGATQTLNSCLELVPKDSPPTTTPTVPANSPARTCLRQLVEDIKSCRTKFGPKLPNTNPPTNVPDYDTKRNAYEECVRGAVAKNSWCLKRKPNNPVATVAFEIMDSVPMTATSTSATVTVLHKASAPLNVYWYATIFDRDGNTVAELSLGMTANVPASPTAVTLPLSGVPTNGVEIVLFGCTSTDTDDLGVGDAAYTLFQ